MLKICDLDCQQSYLESLNDDEVEDLVRGAGSTLVIVSNGSAAVYDDTGAKIEVSSISSALITADAFGNKTGTGGTLIKATVTRPKLK